MGDSLSSVNHRIFVFLSSSLAVRFWRILIWYYVQNSDILRPDNARTPQMQSMKSLTTEIRPRGQVTLLKKIGGTGYLEEGHVASITPVGGSVVKVGI
jgi:hypothetical protein